MGKNEREELSNKLFEIGVEVAGIGSLLNCMKQTEGGERPTIETINNALYSVSQHCDRISDELDRLASELCQEEEEPKAKGGK